MATLNPGVQREEEELSSDLRLESWKEIAAYLKRSVRSVRRWERLEHLPVHRHAHNKQATVYSFRSELDAWLARRQSEAPVANAGREPEAHEPRTEARKEIWVCIPRWAVLGAGAVGLGFLLFVLYGVLFRNWTFLIRL